jgi:hypothetical protein
MVGIHFNITWLQYWIFTQSIITQHTLSTQSWRLTKSKARFINKITF